METIKIIGIGYSGIRTVETMQKKGIVGAKYAICDAHAAVTSKSVISNSIAVKCTSDAIELNSIQMFRFCNAAQKLLIVARLDNALTIELLTQTIALARSERSKIACVLSTPFVFEGQAMIEKAECLIEELRHSGCLVRRVDSESFMHKHAKWELNDAFEKFDLMQYEISKKLIVSL